ncbi:MAG: hypothetical protein HGA51_01280 [Demequinaceae bacterium]|nr:hypothetical protein [Demequinaceae bacterium]
MKTVRSVVPVTDSASMLVADWVASGGFPNPKGAGGGAAASGTGGTTTTSSGYALPQLISAALQKQTFSVGYVLGARYTAQGCESSVQSAMQAAGVA